MITGARQGMVSGLRRLVAFSMTQDLGVYIIPGIEIARVRGLDIEATGMNIVASPRHASVLLIVGEISPALREAAAVIYAQMMRPRVLLALGTTELSPLPAADVVVDISQQQLIKGVHQLRTLLMKSAFQTEVTDFDAPVLQTKIEYTCSMHPEIIRDEPGSCPICGMNLIPREAQATSTQNHAEHKKMESGDHSGMGHSMDHKAHIEYTCPMHPEVIQSEPGSCPECGMNLEPRDAATESKHEHQHIEHGAAIEYTCPMHPEVIQSEPGSCPKCGMNLEPRDVTTESKHEHQHMEHGAVEVEYTCPMHPEVIQSEPGSCPECGMNLEPRETQTLHHNHTAMEPGKDHDEMAFMSMIDVTRDLPRSLDGLPMDWIDVPFGPFFPGLPGGLLLTLTLDGDTVANSSAATLTGNEPLLLAAAMNINDFIERLAGLHPLAPVCYRGLACSAIENATHVSIDTETAKARLLAVEQERITSHLNWLALFGQQTGFDWLLHRATSLQQQFLQSGAKQIQALKSDVLNLNRHLQRTPLLKSRTAGIGKIAENTELILSGPIARASGINNDVRSSNKIYSELGFTPARGKDGDVQARLQLRIDEIIHSLTLIEKMGTVTDSTIHLVDTDNISEASGTGEAVIETPRGLARLQLILEKGQITAAQLETPSTQHLTLIEPLTDQQELGDALIAVGSLDLSPWEIRQ